MEGKTKQKVNDSVVSCLRAWKGRKHDRCLTVVYRTEKLGDITALEEMVSLLRDRMNLR